MDLAICAFLKLTNVQQATKMMEDKQLFVFNMVYLVIKVLKIMALVIFVFH